LDGWEPIEAAVERFRRIIDELDEARDAVVVNGTVMTAWLVSIGLVADGFGFWVNLTQPDGWELSLESRQLHRIR